MLSAEAKLHLQAESNNCFIKFINVSSAFPKHARSQVKGGHSSGEIELIQAADWLAADSTLDFQREFYACSAIVAKYEQSI